MSPPDMTMSQSYAQLRRLPTRPVLVAVISLILVISLLASFGGPSSEIGRFNPHTHLTGGSQPSTQKLLRDITNSTLGFEKIFAINSPQRTDHRDGLILAAAMSGIDIDFVNGVDGGSIPAKVLPNPSPNVITYSLKGRIGAWRAHMNAISEIVRLNITSALIMEDDIDWDVRLKPLLQGLALSTNALQQINSTDDLNFDNLPPTASPQLSPYGDGWDLLWLGHCGMQLPLSGSLVVHGNDHTVPQLGKIISWDGSETRQMIGYPDHTRVIMHHPTASTCSLAYAITQSAARQILYDLGLQRLDNPFDLMLRDWCDGIDDDRRRNCFGVIPQLFDHHRRAGPIAADSDIEAPNTEIREKAETYNIRWSVRLNMDKLLQGDTNYDDQFPDD